MRSLVLAVCLLCGCDRAFGLTERDPLDAPPDAPPDAAGDTDGDTLLDVDDNCPALANLNQHDEDADTVGDVCDNCPHIANSSQDNTDQDNLGEACDASTGTLDCLVRFDPFTGPNVPVASQGTWILEGGDTLAQNNLTAPNAYVLVDLSSRNNPLVITRARVKQIFDPNAFSNLGVWAEASASKTTQGVPDVGFLAEVGHLTTAVPTDNTKAGLHTAMHTGPTAVTPDAFPQFMPFQRMTPGSVVDLRLDMRGASIVQSSARLDGGTELVQTSSIAAVPGGRVAFRTHKMTAAFDYIVIVERRAALPCPVRN